MNILCVVGARPNFVKLAPLLQAFQKFPAIGLKVVHTGQHFDVAMSDVFFDQLLLPKPDYFLGVGGGTASGLMAAILENFERVLHQEQPDWVLVFGDVTSTLACALAAAQHGTRVAHVEAGLRSGDERMPEERNRRLTDALSDLLFVTEPAGLANLQREGIAARKIHLVGNVMIDALRHYQSRASQLNTLSQLGLKPKQYALITIHRPTNVDTESGLQTFLRLLEVVSARQPVVLPMHPRTRTNMVKFGLIDSLKSVPNLRLLEPQGYLEMLNLLEQATLVITDSGGIQEETTYLQVPCLTFRNSTERPITVELGTNQLITDLRPETVNEKVVDILSGRAKTGQIPPLWDGQAANRIAQILSGKSEE